MDAISAIFCVVAIALCFFSAQLEAQPTPLAHWTFNNNTTDISGNGFDATLRGTAGFSDDAVEGSHSLLLNGSSDFVLVGPFEFGDQFTVCAWCFLEDEAENIQTIIGNAAGGSTVDGFKLFINNWETTNKRILIETSDGAARLDAMSPEGTFEFGYWNHVAATIDRANGVAEIYCNGEVVTETGAIVPGFQVTQTVTIGAMPGPSWYWLGMLDDVRIYAGLLTIDEINDVLDDTETGVKRSMEQKGMIEDFELRNYPNPFNPETKITFNLRRAQYVLLEVINIRGDLVRTLVDEHRAPGRHSVSWNGADENGQPVTSGVYFYRLTSENMSQNQKMLLVR